MSGEGCQMGKAHPIFTDVQASSRQVSMRFRSFIMMSFHGPDSQSQGFTQPVKAAAASESISFRLCWRQQGTCPAVTLDVLNLKT